MLMALRQENAPPDQNLPTVPEMMPLQGETGVFYTLVCINKVRSSPATC